MSFNPNHYHQEIGKADDAAMEAIAHLIELLAEQHPGYGPNYEATMQYCAGEVLQTLIYRHQSTGLV